MTNTENNKYILDYIEKLMRHKGLKIYISGPISMYNDDKYALEIFKKKEWELNEHIAQGGIFLDGEVSFEDPDDVLVVNPAFYNSKLKGHNKLTWGDYMAYDFMILNQCDYIYMLDNWQKSEGAKMEHLFAEKCGIKVIRE